MHAHTWLSFDKFIINRKIKKICIHKFNLPNFDVVIALYRTTNFRLFQTETDNFNFDENGRKFSKMVENTVGKGEIAHYEQFLLFPQCFQKTFKADT